MVINIQSSKAPSDLNIPLFFSSHYPQEIRKKNISIPYSIQRTISSFQSFPFISAHWFRFSLVSNQGESMASAAAAVGMIGGGGCGGSSSTSWFRSRRKARNSTVAGRNRNSSRMFSVASSSYSVMDPYKTLRIQPGASESEVKKAFRQLALQYHPDVCRGSNCGVQFSQINEAYDIAIRNLREEASVGYGSYEAADEEEGEGDEAMEDPEWDMWEEWMGWEGAGIRDYSSHINPYI
ncbi:unnamed protein product [Linum tenue]|uniref:J domain-containing protein n=1 Tax=Linum tenue TaxID=586396 RepID=A0AAV0PR58_9ROSI|nr:unnamed protein product [Linum tenue]